MGLNYKKFAKSAKRPDEINKEGYESQRRRPKRSRSRVALIFLRETHYSWQ